MIPQDLGTTPYRGQPRICEELDQLILGTHHPPPGVLQPPRAPLAPLPAALDLADVLDEGAPVEGPGLAPRPPAQLLPVHRQVIGGHDLLEVVAGAQQLVDGGARAHIDQRPAPDLTWERDRTCGTGPQTRPGNWENQGEPEELPASVSPPHCEA